jgi:hypothetical protein
MLVEGPSLAADPPRLITNFKFEVRFSDAVQTYNENPNMVVHVWLPPDAGWDCQRVDRAFVEARVRSGFVCSNDGWKTDVYTIVGCKVAGDDPTHSAGMRIYGPRPDGRPQGAESDAGADGGASPRFGKWIDLAVTCETVATK